LRLPEKFREQLKIPLGKLLLDKETTKENILNHIPTGSYIISVGDATTEKLLNYDIVPSLQIVDAQEKRTKRETPSSIGIKTKLYCDNQAGEISEQSIEEIKRAFKAESPVRITVNGEEDLLVLPVCIHAPDDAIIMYGQPNEGLVILRINKEIRNKVHTILNSMN
jgi:hypothetical protein